MTSQDDDTLEAAHVPFRQRSGTQWMPLMSLLFGVLGVALSPALGIGIVPGVAGVMAGHRARRSRVARVQSGLGLVLSYLAIVVSTGVAIMVAIPLVRGFLISVGFLLP